MTNADKRAVATDALETLGTIIDDSAARDAIHLAVEPVEALHRLCAGDHVGLIDGKASRKAEKLLGIVDPFLSAPVGRGERFWLVVYPRQITSLRHVWAHPDFPAAQDVTLAPTGEADKSAAWIKEYANDIGLGYQTLMDGADEWVATQEGKWGGEYLCLGGLLEGVCTSAEFWRHYEIVRGVSLADSVKSNFFTCSC